ncbi:atp binding protein kinase [Nannochloropsis oceanica]
MSGNNDYGGDDPFAIRILQPNQLRIIRVIGEQRLTIEEETEKRDGSGPRGAFGRIRNKKSTEGQSQTSREMKTMGVGVRLFEAVDSQTGERLIMKEFLPMMRNVAMGEVELYRYLHHWVQTNHPSWQPSDIPIVPFHGYLQTGPEVEDPSFVYDWAERFGSSVPPPLAGNTWVVLRTPGLITLTSLPRLALEREGGGGGKATKGWLGKLLFPDVYKTRIAYLKNLMAGAIDALSLLHEAGVCHGALSPSTLLVSTADLREGGREGGMEVWLSDLGFAKNVLSQEKVDFEGLVKRDWKGCSYSLLEVFLRLMAEDEEEEEKKQGEGLGGVEGGLGRWEEGFGLPFAQVTAGSLQGVTEARFGGDVGVGLRGLVSNERVFKKAVECLDEEGGAGWVLLNDMANVERLMMGEERGVYGVGERLLGSGFFDDD